MPCPPDVRLCPDKCPLTVSLNSVDHQDYMILDRWDSRWKLAPAVAIWLHDAGFKYFISLQFFDMDDVGNLRLEFDDHVEGKLFKMKWGI